MGRRSSKHHHDRPCLLLLHLEIVAALVLFCWIETCDAFFIQSPSSSSILHHHHRTFSSSSRQQHEQRKQKHSVMKMSVGLFGSSGRRPLLSEKDMAAPPDSRVIEAIEKSGQQRVIASDVAAKAGVSLSLARTTLSSLAALTGGDIAVTSNGDLLYTFPSSTIQSTLASNSLRYKALRLWRREIWPILFYAIRVGFGVILFISLFAIFSTIFFVLASSGGSSDSDDRGDRRSSSRGGGGGGFGGGGYGGGDLFFDLFYPRSYFTYRPYGYYGYYNRQPYAARYYGTSTEQQQDDSPNLLERIFSYTFGDGNPNRGLETARLRAAAQCIRDNGGAVVAEQLTPFCDPPPPPSSSSSSVVEESYVLNIVSQLGGEPIVTDEGDIVYIFPELQLSAETTLEAAGLPPDASVQDIQKLLSRRGVSIPRGAVEKSDLIYMLDKSLTRPTTSSSSNLLQEEEWTFNAAGTGWNILSGSLGILNLGGALYLGQLLSSPTLIGVQLPFYFGLVQSAYPFLFLYAIMYNVIPGIRFIWNQGQNIQIKQRNDSRLRWNQLLEESNNNEDVKRKLLAAKQMKSKVRRLDNGGKDDDIVFDTNMDSIDRDVQKEKNVMDDFDQLLKDDNDNDDANSFQ